MPTLPFSCTSVPLSSRDFDTALASLGVDAATAWSILNVESGKAGYLPDRRPQILFERAIFSKHTGGAYDQSNPDISQPAWGGYSGGAAEFTRLAEAYALSPDAALQSASWGLGQIMGFNFKNAGYTSAADFVQDACASEAAQLTQFQNFLSNTGILTPLQNHDWTTVATRYNGTGQVSYYAEKLKDSYTQLQDASRLPDIDVRAAQLFLRFLALIHDNPNMAVGSVDGVWGPHTQAAMNAFQAAQGIPATTGVNDAVLASLSAALPAPLPLNLA